MPATDYIVTAGSPPRRLDVFLTEALPNGSRQRAQALIANDAVRVNGRRRAKGAVVQPGDIVRVVEATASVQLLAGNPDLDVPVLFEDADVIVVDKPAGLPSNALRMTETDTVANFLIARYPELRNVGSDAREPGLVHRLDVDTSGVLLVARTAAALSSLRQQFAARSVTKEYIAIVEGEMTGSGEIDAPIAHDRRDTRRMRVCASPDEASARRARPALTRYRPIERLRGATLLAIEIPTGVMHQIRAHLAFCGHPVVGDELYGGRGPTRQLLHAQRISFAHPRRGERLSIESPLPADLREQIEQLRHVARSRTPRERNSGGTMREKAFS